MEGAFFLFKFRLDGRPVLLCDTATRYLPFFKESCAFSCCFDLPMGCVNLKSALYVATRNNCIRSYLVDYHSTRTVWEKSGDSNHSIRHRDVISVTPLTNAKLEMINSASHELSLKVFAFPFMYHSRSPPHFRSLSPLARHPVWSAIS